MTNNNNTSPETNRGKLAFIAIGIAILLLGHAIQTINWLVNHF